ncbi:MAG: tRNA (adenosine(37)-N6)-dimethylallyltransferase MiaA [Bacteroidales bacterium]|nr:tRNA (adenosine(37)-N6)-dimethylallyltransferase MiaA [Bacteroidales bacterium]
MSKKSFTPVPPMAQLPEPEEIDIDALVGSYESGEIDLICILGPTASGKTRYAVELARRINEISRLLSVARNDNAVISTGGENLRSGEISRVEIISADSRQVYRGMDIGTGKDLDEYGEIPYHLIDIADAGSKYNIFEYQRDFEKVYKEIRERGNIPLLCGGSGLYIEAATRGYSLPEVPANPELREELEKESTEDLVARLASLKPLHNTTDYDTRKRLIRSLEIAIYESEHPVIRTTCLPKNTYYIGTLVSRDVRNERIDRRLDARLREGMIDEIRGLLEGTHPAIVPDKNGIRQPVRAEDLIYYGLEYKFVTLYLTGQISYEKMRTDLATAIHQFAKRQMTWFRGMERKGIRIHWVQV